jgi:two-component system KDP operon response regulator KdpE
MAKFDNHIDGSLILVVEDHAPLLRNIAFVLQVAGFDVMCAESGSEALRLMKHSTPDLVLTDIDLPGLNGYDLLRQIRADRKTAGVPCVVMSDQYDYDSLMYALDLGASEYLPKPFDTDQLLDAVYTALGVSITSLQPG